MLVTPQSIEAGYLFLKACKPFNRWKLPDPEDIEFHVITTDRIFGDYSNNPHTIRVSASRCARTDTFLMTIGHEACHMFQALRGLPTKHNSEFRRLSVMVCKIHGWDLALF